MNHRDYYYMHRDEIDSYIVSAQAGGAFGLLGLSIVLVLGLACIAIAPITLLLLQRGYNNVDNTPGRSLREMLVAHPFLRLTGWVYGGCFGANVLAIMVVMQMTRMGAIPAEAFQGNFVAGLIDRFAIYPIYGQMAAGVILLIAAIAACLHTTSER